MRKAVLIKVNTSWFFSSDIYISRYLQRRVGTEATISSKGVIVEFYSLKL